MRASEIIALTPPGVCNAGVAIAACRAGARGILDCEHVTDAGAALEALDRLRRFTTGPFGIKVGRGSGSLIASLLQNEAAAGNQTPSRLAWIIFAGGCHSELPSWIEHWHARGIEVFLEAITLEEGLQAIEWRLDGVILKGEEAGGRVGQETAFILVQRWLKHHAATGAAAPPFWVQGGIGLNTAAACMAAGAAGVVMDAQFLLTRETPLSEGLQARLAAFDGSETQGVGDRLGQSYRVYHRPGLAGLEEMIREEERLQQAELSSEERLSYWQETVQRLTSAGPEGGLWLLGQDATWAKPFADRYGTVGGVIQGLAQRVTHQLESALRLKPLAENSVLAQRHRTRFPIVQGPMTRVSDVAPFAESVARAGGLPFLALALLRRQDTEKLLKETKEKLGDLSWGVGILGFVPTEIRQEQIEAIRLYKPPFALIAGGRPDQARELEKEGIPTYLHVPSPGLLRMFLKEGARRFVFEGRECGGHVGPRTSFVLWETMCEILLEHLGPTGRGDDLQIIFAGGIHDGLSAAMLSALAAQLAERGVAVGVLMGTAYLFTQEAVASGAIVPRFQEEALACAETVLMESGPGHAIRCIKTPYFDIYESEKQRLMREGQSHNEIRKTLEWMNIGRLRVASKGIERGVEGTSTGFVQLSAQEQFERGMYMIGQVACLHDRVMTMQELHEDVSLGGTHLLETSARPEIVESPLSEKPCDVAIIGMSCFYPQAGNLTTYWGNILNKVNAVHEIPGSHWDWRLYYDPNPRARDKIVSKWGGFLDDVPFDPFQYGITPNSLHSIEPLQLLLLEAVRHGLADAGYTNRPFDRERTAAILGIGGGGSPLAVSYGFRVCLQLLDTVPDMPVRGAEVLRKCESMLPEWTEDSFPGILLNVAVGRVSNRFNFGGPNYAIDAACGSSLAAVQACVRELEMGTSDLAVAMGADTVQTPYAYMAFSKTHALSPRGQCRPFDASADGIALSEGIGVVILKRLADAERDGDRIYAVIKGMGASSDGKDKGLTAPRPEGQLRALRRAYQKAGLSPAEVELVEAHGTGTVVGDQTEALALGQVFREAGAAQQACALGSVKSMIGHSKCAAGIAGLIKTTLAVYHKVLPPTLLEKPNPKANFDQGPLYLNASARPWVHGREKPRCAGVSAFGFGGTNFHLVLQESNSDFLNKTTSALPDWPVDLFVWRHPDRAALLRAASECQRALNAGALPRRGDLAQALWRDCRPENGLPTLAILAASLDELKEKLALALEKLAAGDANVRDPRGIYFAEMPCQETAKVAFLFPGQGSQYPDMLSQLAIAFPEVRETFDFAERVLAGSFPRPLGQYIFPPSAFSPEQEQAARQDLTRTEVAQPALGAAGLAMFKILGRLGIKPDFLAGHSYGEYVALCAAGSLTEEELFILSHRRGQVIAEATDKMPGGMAAVDAEAATIEKILSGLENVTVANLNAPTQTVISGTEEGLHAALERCKERGLRGQRIPVACGFHSVLVSPAREPLAEAVGNCRFQKPLHPVFSNSTAAPYPSDPGAIASLLANHLVSPVRFQAEVEAMYQAGARVFVEVGPQGVLTGLVNQILAGRSFLTQASDLKGRSGLGQLQHLLGQLLVAGVPVRLDRLYEGRAFKELNLGKLDQETGKPKFSASTWMVNSVRNRPLHAPEPRLLGQNLAGRQAPSQAQTMLPSATESGPKTMSPMPTSPHQSVTQPSSSPASEPANTKVNPAHSSSSVFNSNGSANHSVPVQLTGLPNGAGQVMLRFQELMARFLDTQKLVMMTYLQGDGTDPVVPPVLPVNGFLATPPHINGNNHTNHRVLPPEPTPRQEAETPVVANGQASGEKETPEKPVEMASTSMDRDWLNTQLQDLVSKRTGYPREMLGLDLDLEADLGIDSIKRVEILGGLAETMGANDSNLATNLEMEKLTSIKTLRGILDYLGSVIGNGTDKPGTTSDPLAANASAEPVRKQLEVQRALVRLVDAPLSARTHLRLGSGALVFTDDGRGIARDLAGRLAEFGVKTVLLRMGTHSQDTGDVFHADLGDPEAVSDLLALLHRRIGSIAGLVHLLPLAAAPAQESWSERMRREVKSLYLLARGLEPDIREAGKTGGALLLSATSLGGGFGFEAPALPKNFFPGQGGIIGFTKCVAQEWPEAVVRVVDVDLDRPIRELADRLLSEMGETAGPHEVGYIGSRRVTWEPVAAPLDSHSRDLISLDSESTILVTGGARGITAAVALGLAKRFQPKLILVGRSPLPQAAENADTATLQTPAEIKAALIARSQREGRTAAPAAIEAAYQRLRQDREIRANLDRMRSAGARVHYFQVDVRDNEAFGALIDEVQERFGGIDGVIHGAGIIEDRLLRDKTPESFDRVFGTKTESAFILARHLRPERIKFCALFASIASRYGNKGQADYAAANEVLSKLAIYLDQAWPGRVFSVAWGPWSSIGMVADLEKHLTQRGLKLIAPEQGPSFLIDELLHGSKGQTEIIIAGGAENVAQPPKTEKRQAEPVAVLS